MVTRHQSPSSTAESPPEPYGFAAEAAHIPSGAIGILTSIIHDDLDRLRRRAKRDGHSPGVSATEHVLDLFVHALEREAESRDHRRRQEERR